MMKEAPSSSWPDLLPETLQLVLRRVPSLADRVRLRAVCRPWRSNAQLDPLPPLLPWLTLLDGTLLSIPDGKIIRIPIPDKAFRRGSVDSWIFFMHSDGACSLTNPFSKATLNISKLVSTWFNENSIYNYHFCKLVAPSPMQSSPGSLVALILDNGGRIRICQPPIAVDLKLHHDQPPLSLLEDITFFNGKLYGLCGNVLSIFEINYGLDGKPKISSVQCITSYPRLTLEPPQPLPGMCMLKSYLVECCGRLLRVRRMIGCTCNPNIQPCPLESDRTAGFEVFEADMSTKPGQWRCVRELGSQALFVGKHCSKSFPGGECTAYMHDYLPANRGVDPLGDSGVYNMKSGNIKPLLSETAAVPQHRGGQWRPTWIFPVDAWSVAYNLDVSS